MFPFELQANQTWLICPLGPLGRHCLAGNSKGNPMTDVFLTDSNFFYIIGSTERGFVFGTFGLGRKSQGRTVCINEFLVLLMHQDCIFVGKAVTEEFDGYL